MVDLLTTNGHLQPVTRGCEQELVNFEASQAKKSRTVGLLCDRMPIS